MMSWVEQHSACAQAAHDLELLVAVDALAG
jgi:hypothetical protein